MFPIRDSVPSRRFPFVNYFLIAVNLLVFFKEIQWMQAGVLERFMDAHALVPARFVSDPVVHLVDVLTSMFMHGSWGHVIGNMWFLHVFGDNVEDELGHFRYLVYYLLMGVGAAAAQIGFNPHSTLPMVGASGAIAGVLGSYIVLHPRAKILTFFVFIIFVRFIEVPAFFFLGLWFLVQAANGLGSISMVAARGEMGGVAWWAHAGGFAAGFIFIPFFRRRR